MHSTQSSPSSPSRLVIVSPRKPAQWPERTGGSRHPVLRGVAGQLQPRLCSAVRACVWGLRGMSWEWGKVDREWKQPSPWQSVRPSLWCQPMMSGALQHSQGCLSSRRFHTRIHTLHRTNSWISEPHRTLRQTGYRRTLLCFCFNPYKVPSIATRQRTGGPILLGSINSAKTTL